MQNYRDGEQHYYKIGMEVKNWLLKEIWEFFGVMGILYLNSSVGYITI